MKKHTRIWAIVLMLTLIFSFEGLTVFAVNGDEQAADATSDSGIEAVQTEAKAAAATSITVDAKYDQSAAKFTITWTADGDVEDAYTLTVRKADGTEEVFEDATSPYEYSAAADNSSYEFVVSVGEIKGSATGTATKPAAPAPKVTGLVAYPGASQTSNPNAGTVTLYWNADSNSTMYDVYVNGAYRDRVTNANTRALPSSAGGARKVSYTVTGLNEYTTHTFTVYAYNADGKWVGSSVRKQPVRPINYVMKMKRKVTLKSHGGKSQKITLYKNTWIRAYGFSSGKFAFKRNGSIFYLARSRGKSKYAEYAKSWNYSRADAENYVNTANIGSSSGSTLIWVSTYCQHVYFFRGSKGNWRCVRDWECATGTVNGPSPTGMWGNKEIHKKIKKRHGLKFWSCYSSMNAFHGKQSRWKVGKPASSGCIRNANENAQYIYNNAPKRTKVIVN